VVFTPKRKWGRFCCDACRMEHFKQARNARVLEVVDRLKADILRELKKGSRS
jgi:hypothetical protein